MKLKMIFVLVIQTGTVDHVEVMPSTRTNQLEYQFRLSYVDKS